ncbi:D-alanyl-D-alanine carboxypeptidase [Aquirufa beregesia]|nr:D-alanyl-D-alanine carboxypeptidase [Aquirufa beregesia]
MKSPAYLLFFLTGLFFTSCQTAKIKKAYVQSGLNQLHTGILIQDQNGKMVFSQQAEQYFMPASNAKLLTFLLAKTILPDSIPAFAYQEQGDSLYFWGTGDPSTLHAKLKNKAMLDFLQASQKNLVYADDAKLTLPQGAGWAWDDYQDYYAAEISTLPLYENLAHFTNLGHAWKVHPSFFQSSMSITSEKDASRDRTSNQFRLPAPDAKSSPKSITIPYITSPTLTAQLLSDTLHKTVHYRAVKRDSLQSKLVYAGKLDSLLVPLLHYSDNMVGEQLIYLMGAQKGWNGPTANIIQKLMQEPSFEFLKEVKWVDGSGLSRYNLFRPKDMIMILQKLQDRLMESQWKFLLPELGKSGTLKSMKLANPQSHAWAKSGSFGNTYNLSGYYQNAHGKRYLFTIMTNLANQSVSVNKKQILAFLNVLN